MPTRCPKIDPKCPNAQRLPKRLQKVLKMSIFGGICMPEGSPKLPKSSKSNGNELQILIFTRFFLHQFLVIILSRFFIDVWSLETSKIVFPSRQNTILFFCFCKIAWLETNTKNHGKITPQTMQKDSKTEPRIEKKTALLRKVDPKFKNSACE